MNRNRTAICYLTTRYPAPSHSFIQREVEEVRRNGMQVITAGLKGSEERDLLTALDRAHHGTTITCRPGGPPEWWALLVRPTLEHPQAVIRAGIIAVRSARFDVREAVWRLFYLLEAIVLWSRLRSTSARHIHAHFAQGPAHVARLVCDLGNHIDGDGTWSWSFTMHGPHEFFDESRFSLAELTAQAEYVICISDYARSQLMKLIPAPSWGKLRVHHCGLDPTVFQVERSSATPGSLRVLTVARFDPLKGHLVLLEAIAATLAAGIDVHLDLVGDGPERARIEAEIQRLGLVDRVTLFGSLGQDLIVERYRCADAFCLPSFGEGLPVVLMEALACGLPAVTTNIAGIPELIEGGVTGLLVPPGRADLVAQALIRLAQDPALASSLGTQGRARVVEEFDIRRIGTTIAQLHRTGPRLDQGDLAAADVTALSRRDHQP